MWGVKEANNTGSGFDALVPDPRLLSSGPMLCALASCHSIALLHGQPIGDPLELKMIESTGWVRVLFIHTTCQFVLKLVQILISQYLTSLFVACVSLLVIDVLTSLCIINYCVASI